MKLALMIIDLQKAFYIGPAVASMDQAVEYINEVIPWFRRHNIPVIWVQHMNKDNGVIPETEGFEFIDSLKPLAGEHRIIKSYGNSFNKTSAHEILKEEGVDTVLLAGYCAEYCVLSTYRGAEDLDLTPVILKNGIASGNPIHLQMVENISESISYGMLNKVMNG